ncbi:hypothetical protein [Helicobacter felis]|uniref:hypothetical protein n=1 Tax=Helicobacter felis TaxID=214 RepID=UPI000CF1B51C|nr:hypothetical protein [Helicobacter felis]
MANKPQKEIQNSQELMAKMQRLHEVQSQLEKMGAMGLVDELLAIKEQIAMLFEKPKRIRRTKAQMQEAREQEQVKKPKGRKPKGGVSGG